MNVVKLVYEKGSGSPTARTGKIRHRGKLLDVVKLAEVKIKPISSKDGKVVLPSIRDVKAIDGVAKVTFVNGNPVTKINIIDGKPIAEKKIGSLRRRYATAGYKVATTTSDGVVIVEPKSKPDSFGLKTLKMAVHKGHPSETL